MTRWAHLVFLALVCSSFLLNPSLLQAEDVIVLKSGRTVTGKILSKSAESMEVEMVVGKSKATITIQLKDVERIEKGENRDAEFRKRWSALKANDLAGHELLLKWCEDQDLKIQAAQVRQKIEKVKRVLLKEKYPDLWCRPCGASGEILCTGCDGKGVNTDPCQRCAGQGEIGCRACSRKKQGSLDCRRCGGAGVYERFDPAKGRKVKTRCSTCSGKGKIECPTCSGKQKSKCEDCKGKGGQEVSCGSCDGKKSHWCKLCEASGVKGNPEKKALPKPKPQKKEGLGEEEQKENPEKKPVIKKNPFG
jgi:hypothetical protein